MPSVRALMADLIGTILVDAATQLSALPPKLLTHRRIELYCPLSGRLFPTYHRSLLACVIHLLRVMLVDAAALACYIHTLYSFTSETGTSTLGLYCLFTNFRFALMYAYSIV